MKDKVYLERIQAYCIRINTYMSGVQSVDEWISDQQKVDAVMLNLEQIGETAKKLSLQTRTHFPLIHWPSIIGLRNMISHQYEGVKLHIVYDIVMKNIPALFQRLLDSAF
jgi:uncharacterized protein with HEPN domain